MKINKRVLIPTVIFAICAILATVLGLIFAPDDGCKEHTPSEWIVDNAATCTNDGSQHKECTVCGETLETKTIAALGHNVVNHKAQLPTCTDLGWDSYVTCAREGCAYTTYVEKPALNHNWSTEWTTDDTGHWHVCENDGCDAKSNEASHSVSPDAHNCGICNHVLSTCVDEDNDHNCDICGAVLTRCADNNNDHNCDICGAVLSQCKDDNNDHNCDICDAELSQCADNDSDHNCDICGAVLTQCKDDNNDHNCDICGAELSQCADNDNDHNCDICGAELSQCADNNNDHNCDICGAVLTQCVDTDNDHNCDICGKELSQCKDDNNDHNCDICGAELTQCADNDNDHNCDICGAVLTRCADNDNNHNCDICGKELSKCADNDNNHNCDVCGSVLSQCVDNNNDHNCDICGAVLSQCLDENHDHKCDLCGEVYNEHSYDVVKGYTWADDYSWCKVELECSYCNADVEAHTSEISAIVSNQVTQNQSCTQPELTTYTATFDLSSYSNIIATVETQTEVAETKEAACIDDDNDHYCDNCGTKISECEYVDGICKICDAYDTSGTENINYSYDATTESYSVTQYSGEDPAVKIPYYYDDGENGLHTVTTLSAGAFASSNITSIIIPASVKVVDNAAFYGCASLTNIVIPDNVTGLGESAFLNCSALESVTLGSGITSIGQQTFMYCSGLKNVTFLGDIKSIDARAFFSCKSLTSIDIPDSVTSIGDNCFMYCDALETVTLGTGITSIPSTLFGFCSSLESVTIKGVITGIGDSAFVGCTSLTSFTIPDSVTDIDSKAFDGCTLLENISGGNGVVSVGSNVVNDTAWLNNQNGVAYIGKVACDYSGTDTDPVIKEGTIGIATQAFDHSSITSITIGKDVTYINYHAFLYCKSLTTFYYEGTMDEWNAIEKAGAWHENCGTSKIVICTDGEIKL